MADDQGPTARGDPVADARALIAEHFPRARWAVLTGSVITAARTAGSDLDIVVLLRDEDSRAPYRESRYFRGWPVELFVHDEQTLAHYAAKELALRKPHLHRMLAQGVGLAGDPAPWQARCGEVLSRGPAPLTAAEREYARYSLTDLVDDLVHAHDPGERTVIAATLWVSVAREALGFADHWSGHGKWLLRELRALDHRLADRWLEAHGDPAAIVALALEVLDTRMGGPLFDGFHAAGERPPGR
jgi:hypothetical protein